MITILATLFVLSVLVFIHEFGHFVVAKLLHIRVDRFSIGYPPRMVGKKVGETDYCISWIPFGGYVKIAGMVDESLDKEQNTGPPQPWELRSRPGYQKAAVIIAGPVMNLLFAFLIFFTATLIYGVGEPAGDTRVGSLIEDKPAQAAGLMEGDRIVSVDGVPVATWQDLTDIIRYAPEKPLLFEWTLGDSMISAVIVPERNTMEKEDGTTQEIGQVGIWGAIVLKRVGPIRAIANGGQTLWSLGKMIVDFLVKLITRQESLRNVGGPVFIAKMAGDSARSGAGALFGFMAFLSLNLGILNLLPIPVLDGGHLLMIGIESVTGRTIPTKVKLVIQQVFMFLLLALMLFVIYNDVVRIVKK